MNYKYTKFTNNQLFKNTQNLYLDVAGYTIKLTFKPSEHVIYKGILLKSIEKVWGKGGFLKKSSKSHDFEIQFVSNIDKIEIIEKEEGKKHYYLSLIRNLSSKRITFFYNTSIVTFQLLIKEILTFLLNDSGLILHASSCIDKRGVLSIFLAPSGGGKSTTADLLVRAGFKKFSDDLIIVNKTKRRWFFYSPPFIEKTAYPQKTSAQKANFYIIEKSRNTGKYLITEHKNLIKIILQQLWLRREKITKENLQNAMDLAANNQFYRLEISLNDKNLVKILK